MTQPNEAVGGSNETVVAAEPTIEDRFAAIADDKQPEEEAATEEAIAAEAEQALAEEPEAEAEAAEEGEPAPIKPPASFTAEEKEAFNSWPRDAQEAVTRRVGEMEKGLHAKAQEAKQTRSQVEQEAVTVIQQMRETHAAQLQALMPQIPQRPPRQLQADDPWAYAEQMERYEGAVAQANFVQQQLQGIHNQRAAVERAARQQTFLQEQEALREALPEWFDATEGPKLHTEMKSIALDLGYSAEQLNDATANEILALKKVSELKAKADKYDTLMGKRMDQVRAAKGLPKVSRPGVPQGKNAIANQRYAADREAMRKGDRAAEDRVFARFV